MTTTMTTLDLDAIKARTDAATAGIWQVGGEDSIGLGIENNDFGGFAFDVILAEVPPQSDRDADMLCTPNYRNIKLGTVRADAEFIAHAHQDVPALVAEVERLQDQVSRAHDALTDYGRNAMDVSGDLEDGINAEHLMARAEGRD